MRTTRILGALSVGLVACVPPPVSPPRATQVLDEPVARRASEPAPAAPPRAPGAERWTKFPATSGTTSMQDVYASTTAGLGDLASQWKSVCPSDADARRLKIADALAPVAGVLFETWSALVRDRREIASLEQALTLQAKETHVPTAGADVALAWLLAEGLVPKLCTMPPADLGAWVLGAMRFATSSEDVYAAAFEALGIAWAPVPIDGASSPWASQSAAAAVVAARVGVETPPPGADDKLVGVSVSVVGMPGVATLAAARALDAGGPFAGNGRLEGGELVSLALDLRRTDGGGTLISESVVPDKVPPCIVVPWREVELPEVAGENLAAVRLPPILVTERCGRLAQLGLTIRSSSGASTALTLQLQSALEPSLKVELRRDADLPGSSVEHDASGGLVPGHPIELLPVLEAPGEARATLLGMRLAVESDASLTTFRAPRFKTMRLTKDGFVGDDDADLSPSLKKAFAAAIDARSRLSALTADPAGFWVLVDLATERDVAPPAEPQAAPAVAKPKPGWAGGPKGKAAAAGTPAAPAAAPTSTRIAMAAEAWVDAHSPGDEFPDAVLAAAGKAIDQKIDALRAVMGSEAWMAPNAEVASAALKDLLAVEALSPADMRVLLERFEIEPAAAAEIVKGLMAAATRPSPTVTALVAHVDAHAAADRTRPAKELGADEARGVGARVMHATEPATSLVEALRRVLQSRETDRSLDTPSRRLARSLMLVHELVAGLPPALARKVVASSDLLTLDPVNAIEPLTRALSVVWLARTFGVDKLPDGPLGVAILELAARAPRVAPKHATVSPAPRSGPLAFAVRRWVRIPIAQAQSKKLGF